MAGRAEPVGSNVCALALTCPCTCYAVRRKIPPRMGIVLIIADLLVLLTIVISVSRAVLYGQPGGSGSMLLTVCIVVALLIFATVSFTAASGLAQSSSLSQGVLLVFLIVTAIVAGVSWAPKS